MSDISTVTDLYGYYNNNKTDGGLYQPARVPIPTSDVGHKSKTVLADSDEANNTLSFEDMLLLMVTQLQNQTIDNQADTNDMMNQIIQMTVMQAITEMSGQVEDLTEANILSYSASLVGQTVTMGELDKNGNLIGETVGVVTATGTYNGQRVVYIGDKYYPLNQILAVGTLPPKRDESGNETEDPDEVEKPGETENPDGDNSNGSGTDAADKTPQALG